MSSEYLEISAEVKEALKNNKPIVALESTIISHGMPYPKNVETALEVEKIIREKGVIPATIAIIGGKFKIGCSKEEIEYLGKKGLEVAKVSRRDLPLIFARKEDGATTVATTMIGAELAGIKIFATGGIGGVHRGAEKTMDISADLEELASTQVLVVCAGAKSILDLPLTLEYLETKGVPVIGYNTDVLPAFYTARSDYKLRASSNSAKEVAEILRAKVDSNIGGGMVLANPIPEEYSMDSNYINQIIASAIIEADKLNIKGKDVTPFLLDKIQKLTLGKSLEVNIQLVYNNARVASEIAKEYRQNER